jgi:hypothetical protein
MSNIFLKNQLADLLSDVSDTDISLPKWINIVDKTAKSIDDDLTSSAFVQMGGNFSATSATSANNSAKDVNKLISMLTSDSDDAMSNTSTEKLEEQLRGLLNQDGGKIKSKKQRGGNGDDLNVDDIKKFFMGLKSQGVDVNVKLNNKSMSEFFASQNSSTTTEMPELNASVSSININDIISTEQAGGAKKSKKSAKPKKSSKKASKKSSKKASKKSSKKSDDMDGGVNAGFQAFLDLKKHIAEKLGISNGPKAAKVAGAVQKDMKEKHPDLDAVKIAEAGRKHFDANVEHYRQMLPK